jgi:hypothetical protein
VVKDVKIKKKKKRNLYWGGAGRVPVGTLWGEDGGKKVPSRQGGAGTGDGAGIMGRGRGMGSPPHCHP